MKNVLIVKVGAIGDVVMALGMVEYLQRVHPKAQITWLGGEQVVPLLKALPAIKEVIPVAEKKIFGPSWLQRGIELLRIWIKLFGRSFDLVVIGHADWRYQLLSFFVRAKEKRSFSREKGRLWPVPGRYHGNEYLRLISNVDGASAIEAQLPSLNLPALEKIEALQLPSSFVVLAPGGARNILSDNPQRRWPIEHYAQLAKKFTDKGLRVVLTGSATDAWVIPAFQGIPVLNLINQLTLLELIQLCSKSSCVITHDSGPLHLALLARTQVIALFGPTNPSVFVPKVDNVQVLWGGKDLPCRPCYDGKSYAPCSNNRCLKEITPDEVLEKVCENLALCI